MPEKLKKFAESRVKNKTQTQGFFYVIIGGYLLYITYTLVRDYAAEGASIPFWVMLLACIVFTVTGLAVVALGFYAIYYNYNKTQNASQESPQEELPEPPDDPSSTD